MSQHIQTGDEMNGEKMDGSYFDEEYFKPSRKSNYIMPFVWEVEATNSRKIAEYIDKLFDLNKNKSVLDVGCAKGFLVKALMERKEGNGNNIDAYGFDISEWAIQHCEPEVIKRVYVDDITNLRKREKMYDLVYSSSTMEHIDLINDKKDDNTIKNLCSLSKEWIYLDIPIGMGLYNEPWGDPSHVTYMNPSWWISHFLKEGFIFDMRRSRQSDNQQFHSAEMVFRRLRLLDR